jgi:hypothetical protein
MSEEETRLYRKTATRVIMALVLFHLATAAWAEVRQGRTLDTELAECRRLTDQVEAVVSSIEQRLAAGPASVDWASMDRAREPEVASAPPPKKTELRLDGVAWDPQNPLAFLNNKVVQVNDVIEEFTVIAITESSITLRDGAGQRKQLYLLREEG